MTTKTKDELLRERYERLATAISLGTPDRVPIALGFDAFAAQQTGMKIAEFVSDPLIAGRTMMKAMEMLGDVDAIQMATFSPAMLALGLWLSKVDRPGKELPEDSLWQMHEEILMQPEDYDRIVDEGWQPWLNRYVQEHLIEYGPELQATIAAMPTLMGEYAEKGILVMCGGAYTIPYEYFCGARSMKEFMLDLHRMPDKVEAAMKVCMADVVANTRNAFAAMPVKPMSVWVGGWRSASEFLSPRLWDRFVWPYVKEEVEVVLEAGVTPILHFDSNWTRDLERFRELPKGRCVLALDSATDIFKAKEILGDHMCLLGDIPPRMLTLGTPDEVREYCTRLINEVGPGGFILAMGCYLPPDSKLENVRAMIEAVRA